MQKHSHIAELVSDSNLGVWLIGIDGKSIDVNSAMCRILRAERDEVLSGSVFDFLDAENSLTYREQVFARDADQVSARCEIVLARRDGTTAHCVGNEFSLRETDGTKIGSLGLWVEASGAGRPQDPAADGQFEPQAPSMRQGERPMLQYKLLREVHKAAKIGTWEARSDDKLVWSDETLEIFGLDRSEFGGSIDDFYSLIHPEDIERVKRVADFADSRKTDFKSEYRIVRRDGELRHMRQAAIVLRDPKGKPIGFSGVVQDVTDQVGTEAKLRQAQKMEAIGQLSGGVAHDFNNILASIMSAAELLHVEEPHQRELVDSIIGSVKRGAELTHRLLAFARKQPLRTTQFSVARLVDGMAPMLDRLVGQDIRLKLEVPDGLWHVEADPAPLEEALLNLAINSRDAIASAGVITVSCRNISQGSPSGEPKEYVEITVSDTGIGMSETVRAKASEPFFTTKPVGKGSGLGLSMVEGYVRQTGGQMTIRSKLGLGTRISLLMPRARHPAARPAPKLDVWGTGNGETILILDDNKEFAMLLLRQLNDLGYQATYAENRQIAIEKTRNIGGFDVVLSDVLLADGERGPKVVNDLVRVYPNMKPIFMTGYTSDSDDSMDSIESNIVLLKKPFRVNHLSYIIQRIK